jgi:hypothetical protein
MRKRPWTVVVMSGSSLLVAALAIFAVPAVSKEPHPSSGVPAMNSQAPKIWRTNNASWDDPGDTPVATTLDSRQAKGVLGSAVRSVTNEDMGRIIDVVVDRAGTPRAAVIDFGGFLGVGSRKIAIDWNSIQFSGAKGITLDLTRDQVKAAPQYQDGKAVVVLGAAANYTRSRVSERTAEP